MNEQFLVLKAQREIAMRVFEEVFFKTLDIIQKEISHTLFNSFKEKSMIVIGREENKYYKEVIDNVLQLTKAIYNINSWNLQTDLITVDDGQLKFNPFCSVIGIDHTNNFKSIYGWLGCDFQIEDMQELNEDILMRFIGTYTHRITLMTESLSNIYLKEEDK